MKNIHILKNSISSLRETIQSQFLKFHELQDRYPESNFTDDILREEITFINDVKPISILYLDDDETTLHLFKRAFKKDFNIFLATTSEIALNILNTENIDILITDNIMPNINGVEFLVNIKNSFIDYPIFMLTTAYMNSTLMLDAINKVDIYKFIEKPFNISDVKQCVNDAYNNQSRK